MKAIEDAIKEARKEIKRLHKTVKTNGHKSKEGREALLKESEVYKEFLEKYGRDNLIIMKVGKSSNFGKLQNSKGNKYGGL